MRYIRSIVNGLLCKKKKGVVNLTADLCRIKIINDHHLSQIIHRKTCFLSIFLHWTLNVIESGADVFFKMSHYIFQNHLPVEKAWIIISNTSVNVSSN